MKNKQTKLYNKQQALDLISEKRKCVYEIRNMKDAKEVQRLCVNELSRLNKMTKRVKLADDNIEIIIKKKDDYFNTNCITKLRW